MDTEVVGIVWGLMHLVWSACSNKCQRGLNMAFKVLKRKGQVFCCGPGRNREAFARFEFCPDCGRKIKQEEIEVEELCCDWCLSPVSPAWNF
jgi:hypothetical protein